MSLLILFFGIDPDICLFLSFLQTPTNVTDSPRLEGSPCPPLAAEPGQVVWGFVQLWLENLQGKRWDQLVLLPPHPTNFCHVRAVHNTPENHYSITAAIKLTISHQPIQLSLITVHLPSLCFTCLSKIPRSCISFLPTKALPYSWRHLPPRLQEFCSWYLYTRGTQQCLLSGNAKPLSFQRRASGKKALPDKGWRKQRAEETPAHHLWLENNFQPLKNLQGFGFISSSSSVLCFQAADGESAADEDDASGEEILVTGAEEKRQQVVRGGGKGAYIKQQNSETDNAFLEERNVRGREQSSGNYRTARCIIKVRWGSATSCNNTHPINPSQTQGMSIPPPSSNIWGNFQAPTPHYHKRQEFGGLLRSEIQEKCLQNYCT